tara:strand:+ start:214 stop:834 length:621 start_codon:yes stop_codon:yes gene_type:complete
MTRPNSTTKESNNNYEPANGTGASVRAAIKDIFGALRTLNAGSGDPSGAANLAAYQPHIDSDTNLLKIRNGGNSAFVTLGNVSQTNFGHAALSGATFTGSVIHNYTGALRLPVGTTGQRPSSPSQGDIRFNTSTNEAEIFNGTSFTEVGSGAGATGGGNDQVFFENDQVATTNYTITTNKHAHSVSPTISSGVTITVPTGAILVIL